MNKDELKQWIKDNPKVDESDIDLDGSDNRWYSTYHKVDDEYYQVDWLNGDTIARYISGKGYTNDYTPHKVIKRTELIEVNFYDYSVDNEESS